MAVVDKLLTAEEYRLLPDDGQPTELVRGRIIEMNVPAPRHGQICSKVDRIVGNFADEHDLGHVVSNDSGVITEHDPDTVRGPDVAFYSYDDVPRGPLPRGYLKVAPRLVFEVLSPDDRWPKVLGKVSEYLDAGVRVVCVVQSELEQMHVYFPDKPSVILKAEDEFTVPEVLPEFRVQVQRFFE